MPTNFKDFLNATQFCCFYYSIFPEHDTESSPASYLFPTGQKGGYTSFHIEKMKRNTHMCLLYSFFYLPTEPFDLLHFIRREKTGTQ